MRYAKLGLSDGRRYRVPPAGDEWPGAELPVFDAVADGYRLRPRLVYADALLQLGYATDLLTLGTIDRARQTRSRSQGTRRTPSSNQLELTRSIQRCAGPETSA